MSNGGEAVRLERTFAADIDRVFHAFTDPAELVHWWGPMNVPTSVAEIDLRQYQQGWDAALASLTRHFSREKTNDANR